MTWTHTPRLAILLWIGFTFPFTVWDSLYIFLRPHTLLGHKWHSPIWDLIDKYAAVDKIYSKQAWSENEGWTAAQGVINMTEVGLYLCYFWLVQTRGESRRVRGRVGGLACVLGLVAGTVTLTKSCLYWMRECFSGFKYVGHADWRQLLSTWVFMNVLYCVISSYMILTFAKDIITGLSLLEETTVKSGQGKKRN